METFRAILNIIEEHCLKGLTGMNPGTIFDRKVKYFILRMITASAGFSGTKLKDPASAVFIIAEAE